LLASSSTQSKRPFQQAQHTITTTATSRRVRRGVSAKDLDTCSILRIRHADVVHIHVCHNVSLTSVLAERADGDAVGAVALHVGDDHVGRIGLEGDAVVVWRC